MQAITRSRAIPVALAIAFLCFVSTALAAKFDAKNAAKVDGLKAVKATSVAKKRKGKLVATDANGLLPNNIVGLVAAATHAQSADSATNANHASSADSATTALGLSCSACVGPSDLTPSAPASGQVLAFNGTTLAWVDQPTPNAGTITAVTTSGGLSGGGSSGSVNVGVDPTQLQNRVTGNCASGSALQSVNQDGTVGCGTTTPSGSAGGDLSGTYPNPSVSTIGGHTPITDASSAGGALSGTYPNPTLNVSGGDNGATACKTGEFVSSLSGAAALGCGPTNTNTALGANALVEANNNNDTAVGSGALEQATAGNDTAVGQNALNAPDTGGGNSALGTSALSSDSLGFDNTAVGQKALTADMNGFRNVALGSNALKANNSNDNTALGYNALLFNFSGQDNTAVGDGALNFVNTGASNTALGAGAGDTFTTGSDNIDIANHGVGNESGTIRIGTQGDQTKAFLAGVSGVTTGDAPAAPVLVDDKGQLGVTSSSRRFKRDIHPLGSARKAIMRLRPVSFRYKRSVAHGQTPLQFGLIAEQVAKVYPNLVVRDSKGRPNAVAYQELPALELAALQHQRKALRRQRGRNQAQGRRIRSQGKQIVSLRRAVSRLSRRR